MNIQEKQSRVKNELQRLGVHKMNIAALFGYDYDWHDYSVGEIVEIMTDMLGMSIKIEEALYE
jgi:hypothetical protein